MLAGVGCTYFRGRFCRTGKKKWRPDNNIEEKKNKQKGLRTQVYKWGKW